MENIRVDWQFSNGHEWFKHFASNEEAWEWIRLCALDTHYSVTYLNVVEERNDDGKDF